MNNLNTNQHDFDAQMLAQALTLAENGLLTTTPNPRVGCVITRQGSVIAQGWHERAGMAHAEVLALAHINHQAAGADVYISLSPCTHDGKTPPCVDALIAAKPARVVIAIVDPYATPIDESINRLRAAGIAIAVASSSSKLGQRAMALNVGFFSRLLRQRPWLRLKIAATMDGKTALDSGLSRWISSEESRRDVHTLRASSCALLTGIGTALQDNPLLTVRHVPTPRQPLRVLVDSYLRVLPDMALFNDDNLLVATATKPPADFPAEVVVLPNTRGRVDLAQLMTLLADRQINEVTVEAGRQLNGALLAAGLVDEIVLYLAPRLFGSSGKDMFDFPAPITPAQAPHFERIRLSEMGDSGDIKIVYRCRDSWAYLQQSYSRKIASFADGIPLLT